MCLYFLGCVFRMTIGNARPEFSTMARSMLTLFRCLTDGCSAFDGTPLQSHLHDMYGHIFVLGYYVIYLAVTIGIFNLIMAIFIEAVLNAGVKRTQQQLGEHRTQMENQITEFFYRRFAESQPDFASVWAKVVRSKSK